MKQAPYRSCDRIYAEGRLEQARLWAKRAMEVNLLLADGTARAMVVSDAALAGIAASDAICCKTLGKCSKSPDHQVAVALLKAVPDVGKDAAPRLKRLVNIKPKVQYLSKYPSASEAQSYIRAMQGLIEVAQEGLDR